MSEVQIQLANVLGHGQCHVVLLEDYRKLEAKLIKARELLSEALMMDSPPDVWKRISNYLYEEELK